MYKVLIVDDDIEILEYISNMVDWENLGYQVIGTEVSGTKAARAFMDNPPDLLVTDITMPGITGLELVRRMGEKRPGLRSIILTCHEEFGYAREALQLGVEEYLVKYTLEKEEFESCLKKIKKSLDEQACMIQQMEEQKRQLKKNAHMLNTRLLRELIETPDGMQSRLEQKLKSSELAELTDFQVICFCIPEEENRRPDDRYLLQDEIICQMEEADRNNGQSNVCACYGAMIFWFIKEFSDKGRGKWFYQELAERVGQKVRNDFGVSLTVLITEKRRRIHEIPQLYQRLREMRFCAFYPSRRKVIWESDLEGDWEQERKFSNLSHQLLNAVYSREYTQIVNQIEAEYQEFYENGISPQVMLQYYEKFMRHLKMELWQQRKDASFQTSAIWTYEDCIQKTRNNIKIFLDMEMNEASFLRRDITEVTDYIKKHLSEKITCENMAQMINMNVSYFSKLFKKETGRSFSEYLIEARIEKATMLLKYSQLTLDEITAQIGLSDMHYFCRLYKQKTGKTPGDVKKVRKDMV